MFVGTKFGLFMPGLRPTTGKEAKPENDPRELQVRSRRRIDLDRLREYYLPALGPTLELKGHDYQFRAYCTREQWGEALRLIALDIDYTKFKDSPKQLKDHALVSAYLKIWSATLGAFPHGSIYGGSWYTSHTPARRTTYTVTEEIGERVSMDSLTENQRRLLDEEIARSKRGRGTDRLWDEREPDLWELAEIEDEHKAYLWNTSEEQRKRINPHRGCGHVDTRNARKKCNRKRKAG